MSEWKQRKVSDLAEKIKKSNVVGILTVRNLPTKQLQQIKTTLPAEIVMAKKNLMLRAIGESKKKGINDLEQYITDQPAFIFADDNPFRLCSIIGKNRSPAPAKGGDTAPNDIVVEKGPTAFMAGPVLGELKGVGIPCKVEGGKIAISETKTILKAGEEISEKLAEILGRIGIEPMEIGLDLLACYEGGSVFPKDVLAIDEEEYLNNFIKAYQNSLNLSVEAAYPTSLNVEILVQKCFGESKGLAIEAGILNAATVGEIIGRTARAANSLSSMIKVEAPQAEAPKEEAKKPKDEASNEGPKAEAAEPKGEGAEDPAKGTQPEAKEE